MLYITTSRKPSVLSRRLAKGLARVLRAESENRGKRSVQESLERAQAKGYSRCLIIYEKHGNPDRLCFLEEGKWLPAIVLKNVVFLESEQGRRRLPGLSKIVAQDADGKKIAELFETPEVKEKMSETFGGVELHASAGEVSFSLEGKKIGPVLKIKAIEEAPQVEEENAEENEESIK